MNGEDAEEGMKLIRSESPRGSGIVMPFPSSSPFSSAPLR